jgi:Uma2 family endonuclease
MAMGTSSFATLDDLYREDGKAELIGGRIVRYPEPGQLAETAAEEIFISLRLHAKRTRQGLAHPGGVSYVIAELPSGRETFSPDSSWFAGEIPVRPVRFMEGSPIFAVEVRDSDGGIEAESEIAGKRADYFAAGTLVVWDVDPSSERVTVYRRDDPTRPASFQRGDVADAEPAVPGWRMLVDEIFLG